MVAAGAACGHLSPLHIPRTCNCYSHYRVKTFPGDCYLMVVHPNACWAERDDVADWQGRRGERMERRGLYGMRRQELITCIRQCHSLPIVIGQLCPVFAMCQI